MKKVITVTHENIVIPKGCRKPRNVPTQSEIEVEVREVTYTDAPVAMVVTSPACDQYSQKSTWGPTGEVRQYNGQLYTRLMNNYSGKSDQVSTVTPEIAIDNTVRGCTCGNDSLDKIERGITRYLAELLFIGEDAWHAINEPVYSISTFGFGGNHGGTGLFVNSGHDSGHFARTFRADELGLAKAAAIKTALDRGDTASVASFEADNFDHIEVLIPSAVRFESTTSHGRCSNCGEFSWTYCEPAKRSWNVAAFLDGTFQLGNLQDAGSANDPYLKCDRCGTTPEIIPCTARGERRLRLLPS